MVAALASLFVRNLAVLFTALVDLPAFLRKSTSLVVCTSDQDFMNFNITEDVRCVGFNCLDFCNPGNISEGNNTSICFTHRFRECGNDNDFQTTTIFNVCLAAATIMSLISTWRLNKLSDYERLYQASKGCFLAPIVHRSLFHSYIKDGNAEEVKNVLEYVDINRQDHEGFSPVHLAVLHSDNDKNRACLSLLLDKDASPDEDSRGRPLMTAVNNQDRDSALQLLVHGAFPEADSRGRPLLIAIENQDRELIAKLFDHGASPDEDSRGCPLRIAMDNQDWDIAVQLLLHGANLVRSPDGHLPLNLYGDTHAAFPEGRSMPVRLAKAGDEETVQTLIEKQKEKFPAEKRDNCGVHHLVINHSDVTCLLRTTKKQELLEIFAPSFSSSNFSKEEGKALTRELEDLGVEIEEPAIWLRGEKRESKMWSDGECYHCEKKRLTGIQVAVDDQNNKISRLRVAFDNEEWGSWRRTADEYGTSVEQPALLLQEGEAIIGVTTTHTNQYRWLSSLELTLNTGRCQFWGSTDTRGKTRIKSVLEKCKLAYLSGGEDIGYYQLTFHWEGSGPCD